MAELIIYHKGRPILREILFESMSIGSSNENDICLPELLRYHAKVELTPKHAVLVEQEGTVYVNGEKVLGSAKLEDNDLVDLGAYRLHYLRSQAEAISLNKKTKTATLSLSRGSTGKKDVLPTIRFLKPFKSKKRQHRIILGRGMGCDVKVSDSHVSSQHAEISLQGSDYYIQDLGSSNGTFVNDYRVERERLPHMGTIRLGRYSCTYQVEYPVEDNSETIEGYPVPDSRSDTPPKLIVGKSPAFRQMMDELKKVCNTDKSVLLLGESGSGKELLARYLHFNHKSRQRRHCVTVNCAAIPDNLAESQIFGHAKGSFSGAVTDHKGFFKEADGGTLFLDEIGELPMALQAKLLRVFEDGIVRPVGSEREYEVNVRIVAATNRDLEKAQDEETFRHDLFERFDWHINVPPLRQRRTDIPLLIKYFINIHATTLMSIDRDLLTHLKSLPWVGNIRRLDKVVGKAITMAAARGSNQLTLADFQYKDIEAKDTELPTPKARQLKRARLRELLRFHKGNISRVSRELDVSRLTIRRWCEDDGIDISKYK